MQTDEPSVEDIIAARINGNLDPLAGTAAQVYTYMRTGKEPMREEPDGNP